MPAVPGLGDLQLEVAGEGVGEDLAGARTGGGSSGIDHEKSTHVQSVPTCRYPAHAPSAYRAFRGAGTAGATLLG
ncbi:hypothetical protein JCM4914_25700 [Streptomyces platensis subsp. malvinus]